MVSWEVKTDDGWKPFDPGFPFDAKPGDVIRFCRASFQYKAVFQGPCKGFQENIETQKRRPLRPVAIDVPDSPVLQADSCDHVLEQPSRRGDFEALQLLEKELQELLAGLSSDEPHPVHAMLQRAQTAQKEGHLEIAFDELLNAQELLKAAASDSGRYRISTSEVAGADMVEAIPVGAATSSAGNVSRSDMSRRGTKRSASTALEEATGEPSHVARRLLKDSGDDEAVAFKRWLLIHDLEQGSDRQVELNREAVECPICADSVQSREAVRFLPCQHGWFCIVCIQRAADAKIAEGATLRSIGCLECGSNLQEPLLQALLSKTQMERLQRQSLESAVNSLSGLRPCPTPDCPNRVVLEDGVQPRLRCEVCKKEHCLLCSASPFHHGQTCEEHLASVRGKDEEKSLRRWMAEVGARQCPSCGNAVTKHQLEGQETQTAECHKMICRSCRTRFCYGCLAILTPSSTCGCTPDEHGFIDPDTGNFVRHLSAARRRGRGKHK